ncbi:MAG: HAMP domain-containing histidine kinase [Armatimonadetes bacterium]|nr:HAMP domain-containing histidine kinase [Armatimonadota bacterium]
MKEGPDLPAPPEVEQVGDLTLAETASRLAWLIELRWLAATGVVVLPLAATNLLGYQLPIFSLALVGLSVAAYNLAFRAWLKVRWQSLNAGLIQRMANVQIAADLAALTVVLHLSGGIENPLACYYVFHIIIAATMLSPAAAYAQATWAILLYGAMVLAEATGWLPHHRLRLLMALDAYQDPRAWVPVAALASLLYVSAYLTCSIVQRLRQREAELEQISVEAHGSAAQCRAAYDRLLAVQRAQVQYMRRIAHELKSPLAAIAQVLSVVLEGLTGEVPEQQRHLLERSYHRAQDAIAMLSDLLDLARMRELPREEFGTLDVNHLVETVLDEFTERAEARNITLEADVEDRLPSLYGDDDALTTMLANLVSNAIKYSHEGGRVRVSVRAEGDEVVLEVSDDGPGIADEDLPRIFDEFYRTPQSRQSGIEGTGLGLPIVRSIVDRHGGTIDVRSKLGEGTTFTVRLPAYDPARHGTQQPGLSPDDTSGLSAPCEE